MSRSDHAQTLSFSKSRTCAAVSCMLLLTLGAGCRFSTNPGESIIVEDGRAEDARVDTTDAATPAKTSTGTKAAPEPDAAVTTDAGEETHDNTDAAPTAASTAAAGSSAPTTPATGAATPAPAQPAAGAAAPASPAVPAMPPPAAGSLATPTLPVTTPTQGTKEAECSADLASCLLRDPLAYAECLRTNQDNGCPEPDAGVPVTTSPVTTEDGKPLSQACQAELASCIARLPTPENAASCTEKARKCK